MFLYFGLLLYAKEGDKTDMAKSSILLRKPAIQCSLVSHFWQYLIKVAALASLLSQKEK